MNTEIIKRSDKDLVAMREAFEKWFENNLASYPNPEWFARHDNDYDIDVIQNCWLGWQGSAQHQATELKQLRAERVWKSMDTAPRDGTRILVLIRGGKQQVVRWQRLWFMYHWIVYGEGDTWIAHRDKALVLGEDTQPIGWMHLPLSKLTDSAQSGEEV